MSMVDSVHEECGVFGIYDPIVSNVAQSTYFALYALQHRGQESCGIAVNEDGDGAFHNAALRCFLPAVRTVLRMPAK